MADGRLPMFSDLNSSGAMPALEAMVRFAGQRQRLIASNIANISTPDYRMRDVSPQAFQEALREAVDQRRGASQGGGGDLPLGSTREVQVGRHGELALRPTEIKQGILFHDRNNRDLERLMQDEVENATVFRVAADLLKSRYDIIRSAISERV
jgi:flagellar basal-body rod protein FlgB